MSEKDEARAEAERRYPKKSFVYESHVQKSFVAGAEWQASRKADVTDEQEALTDTALWDFANDLLELWNFRDLNEPSLIEQFRDTFVARFGNPHQVRVQANSEEGLDDE
jgi:hypothetical protein